MKKISLLTAVILIIQILLPVFTMVVESDLTIKSIAAEEEIIGTWDISADDGESNVQATLYEGGTLVISGTGKMRDYVWTSDIRQQVKRIRIENGIKNIGNNVFNNFSNLIEITIANSVESIGDIAFNRCNSLVNIIIPNSVTSIGKSCFANCKNLKSVQLSNAITRIEDYTFGACHSLKEVNISNGVTSIGNNAFQECQSLVNIIIPNGVTSIGNNAFQGCQSLVNIIIPNSVTSIGEDCFLNCKNLKSVQLSNAITRIENHTFCGCDSLREVNIPNGVEYIGNSSFARCYLLKDIVIPDSIEKIGSYAFSGCKSLRNISIPQEITELDTYSFEGCNLLCIVDTLENGNIELDLPDIIKRVRTEDDILKGRLDWINCELSEDETKVIVKGSDLNEGKDVRIYVKSGKLYNFSVRFIKSGTIEYMRTNPTNQDVHVLLNLTDEELELNNDIEDVHCFTENGTYDFKYMTANNQERILRAEVTWIDKIKPEIKNVQQNPDVWENGDATVIVTAQDEGFGLADKPYSFDDGHTWQEENYKTYTENAIVRIKVRDMVGNITERSNKSRKICEKSI